MQWHYFHNAQSLGPVSETDLEMLIKVGTLPPDVLVWSEGMADWQPYSAAKSPVPHAPAVQPAQLRVATAAPAAVPIVVPQMAAPAQARQPASDIAPLGHRIAAKAIDFAVLGICLAVIVVLFQWGWSVIKQTGTDNKQAGKFVGRVIVVVVGLLLALFYRKASSIASNASPGQRSPGKRLMKLAVVDRAGRPIGFSTKLARFFVQVLMVGGVFFVCLFLFTAMAQFSMVRRPPPTFRHGQPQSSYHRPSILNRFLLGFVVSFALSQAGYAVALFNPQRRGLHDLLCGTRVIQVT